MLAEPIGLEPEGLGVGADPGERSLCGLLHHVAELTRDRQPALSGIRRGLEEENVATDRGEGKSSRHTGFGCALAHLALVAARPERRAHALLVDTQLLAA